MQAPLARIGRRPFVTTLAAALIFFAVVGYRLAQPYLSASRDTASPVGADGSSALDTFAPASAKDAIERTQARIKANPNDQNAYATLGLLMLQRVRETADPNLYIQADQAFHEALRRDPQSVDALIGMGSLSLSRHEFAEAVTWGEKARALNPYRAAIYGIIGDAQVELGRYEDATQTIQKMVDTRPDIASYSRVSYVRELHGDVPGAIDAMQHATRAGAPGAEATLWSQTYVGNLSFNRGDLKRAEQDYSEVLAQQPAYPYAQAGMARVRAAQGRPDEAVALYQSLLDRLPLPQFAIELGELYESLGQPAKAKAQFDLVRAIQQLNVSAQMNIDMEMALFEADHGDTAKGLTLARAAYAKRPSIHGADALAWALYRAGQFNEARTISQAALKLGTQDATLHFHAGMIAAHFDPATAQAELQKALDINPYFSVRNVPVAHSTLRQLTGS